MNKHLEYSFRSTDFLLDLIDLRSTKNCIEAEYAFYVDSKLVESWGDVVWESSSKNIFQCIDDAIEDMDLFVLILCKLINYESLDNLTFDIFSLIANVDFYSFTKESFSGREGKVKITVEIPDNFAVSNFDIQMELLSLLCKHKIKTQRIMDFLGENPNLAFKKMKINIFRGKVYFQKYPPTYFPGICEDFRPDMNYYRYPVSMDDAEAFKRLKDGIIEIYTNEIDAIRALEME